MAETANNLSRKQKLALIGLAFFGVFILSFSVFNLKQDIKKPLASKKTDGARQSAAPADESEKQKTLDSDTDGLFDWDELNVYGSSPYLEDSDSDGIYDRAELENGTNPNDCQSGGVCPAQVSAPIAEIEKPLPDADLDASAVATIDSSDPNVLLLSGQSDAASLRKALIGAGVDEKQLSQISDENLLKTYKDAIASSTE
jgi:hypothetical protein